MANFDKEIVKEEKSLEKSIKKYNPWMIASCVLGVLLLIAAIMVYSSKGLSENKATGLLIENLNGMVGGGVTLINSTDLGGLYEVSVSYQGQVIPVYITKDGEYMAMGVQEIKSSVSSNTTSSGSSSTSTKVPKTDKPIVEAFVFSYCPYGLQFEKALSPVYTLLKNKADINLVAIGAMHGPHEEAESLRQLCIQKNYGKDKLWAYLDKFMASTAIGTCNSDTTCAKPFLEAIMKSLSIDVTKINTCISNDAQALYEADNARAASLGISGSPGFVINGVQVQVSRSPEAIKQAICDAFTTAPSECSRNLSTTQASPSFGASSGSGSATTASC